MAHEVVATEALLEEWLFDKEKAEVLLAVVDWIGHAWTGTHRVLIFIAPSAQNRWTIGRCTASAARR